MIVFPTPRTNCSYSLLLYRCSAAALPPAASNLLQSSSYGGCARTCRRLYCAASPPTLQPPSTSNSCKFPVSVSYTSGLVLYSNGDAIVTINAVLLLVEMTDQATLGWSCAQPMCLVHSLSVAAKEVSRWWCVRPRRHNYTICASRGMSFQTGRSGG